ncbi:unnamed protein product [Auanema sp. JU1783]|nr:unnamed protein product [Auanema sp. JU1783]
MINPAAATMKLPLLLFLAFSSNVYPAKMPLTSCRKHYLSGIRQSQPLPINLEDEKTVNILCKMPESADDGFVETIVHSGISKGAIVEGKKSINYQMPDLNWMREVLKSSYCSQTLTIDWRNEDEMNRGNIEFITLLNDSFNITYDSDRPLMELPLAQSQVAIRHVFVSKGRVKLQASPLQCRQNIESPVDCLFTNRLQISLLARNWNFNFAFRTGVNNPFFIALRQPNGSLNLAIENDFFIRINGNSSNAVGFLTDSNWHSVSISENSGLTIDNYEILPFSEVVKFDSLLIDINGDILVTNEEDEKEECMSLRDSFIPSEIEENEEPCAGCDCSILGLFFKSLASPSTCPSKNEDDGDAYHLIRDSDKLSFFHIAEDTPRMDIRTALTFKSDSDAGLLLFGYWNFVSRGRWQVHYRGSHLIAIMCEQEEEEEQCRQCSIQGNKGLGNDEWHNVAFFAHNSQHYLILNQKICQLQQIHQQKNISIADLYSVPNVVNHGGIFIGGTYYEIKKPGLYMNDITIKYFENTREKIPSLRGCVKDVYIKGEKIHLSTVYEEQRKSMLVDYSDFQAFSLMSGCLVCDPLCAEDVRCRVPFHHHVGTGKCDCSDIYAIESDDGSCKLHKEQSVPLSTKYVNVMPFIMTVPSTRALIQNIWIKFKLPKNFQDNLVIAEFNNHREMLFRVFATPDGRINTQATPSDLKVFEPDASKLIDKSDSRVHLLVVRRRTPIGTRQNHQRYELIIDGSRYEIPDYSRSSLNNITLNILDDASVDESPVIHDIGVGYEPDEHTFHSSKSNKIYQIDVFDELLSHVSSFPEKEDDLGFVDPYLWHEQETQQKDDQEHSFSTAPFGTVDEYTPDTFQPQSLLPISAQFLFYAMIAFLTFILLLLCFFCCYWCIRRNRKSTRDSTASDTINMLRSSPDYPVKLRRDFMETTSLHDDSSIGTDDTDLNAYRDIHSHRVKIYRESMVSILVPSLDYTHEAAIVKRQSLNEVTSPSPPFSSSPAPLVDVQEDD